MFGERLKELRIEKGLTQEELGKILNKTKNNISQYETSKREPDSDTLKTLADFFAVSIDYLLGRTDFKNSSIFDGTGIIKKTLDEIDIVAEAIKDNPELQELVKTLEQRPDLMVMFKKSKRLTPDAVKQILGIIKLIEDKESAEP